jgi:ubiquitin C-terminal hydrolase
VQSTGNEPFEDLIGTIDMKVIREESNLYELTGVLVHSGSANSGHYYSYIKEKDGRWLEFNDTVVKEFNP